jgi:thiamine pyrophosphate-dependent acetolactate synthase large subunit-like protein
MKGRAEAIRAILARHGPEAVYVASTGYVSRSVAAVAGDDYQVFYMQGSMGMAPGIGLGLAMHVPHDVVVVNGDASLLMSLGTTHTIRDRGLSNLFHYVLDNGCHESVGGQPCAQLEPGYPGVTEVIKITRDGRPPRVPIDPITNTGLIRESVTALRSAPERD